MKHISKRSAVDVFLLCKESKKLKNTLTNKKKYDKVNELLKASRVSTLT